MRMTNRRRTMAVWMILTVLLLVLVTAAGWHFREAASLTDFSRKNLAPCPAYPFGTDFMGRDMFLRTLAGLSSSIRLGVITAAVSAVIAFFMGLAAAVLGRTADAVIGGLIDLIMGIPHILLLILISYACGKGFWGVTIGISLTHWTSLARLIRGEVLQLKESTYVKIASRLGHGKLKTAFAHMTPHLLPQFVTGLVLMFPHAILHEASVTFLGFGLPPEEPAVGIILSASMKCLVMGKWCQALFPGLLLAGAVLLFHFLGQGLLLLWDPENAHR